jgi:hypothetical protein
MVSNKQLKANQQNALSGGVKTPEGKAISRFNAFKHGILSQLITEYEKGFYSNILDDLKEQYQPIGIIEQVLIERIAIYYLKLFRVQKAETEYMKSELNPRKTKIVGGIETDPEGLLGEIVVVNEGYTPTITDDNIQKLTEIYARYETTIENRLFRAIHELERIQRLRRGEKISPPIMADINKLGSFGENNKNL